MRFSEILSASAILSVAAAHGNAGIPKIFGLPAADVAALKARNILGARRVAHSSHAQLAARQGGNAQNRCGKQFGCATCDPGYCCSLEGYCGQGSDFCQAPDSQFEYGPAADANQVPPGGSTRNTARPKNGAVLYGGEGIYVCTKPGQIAITYDDGPYEYTPHVLDLFQSYGFKATFFVTGINLSKGRLDDSSKAWASMITRMINEGHQVASHTWSHQDLSAITKEQRYDQMVRLEMALTNIIGKFPTYMRPPFSSCSDASGCPQDMADLGYHISYFDLDTDDYNNITPELQQNAKNKFAAQVNPSNAATDEFLAIAHDIHYQTAYNLTGYMLDLMTKKGYVGVTMGECLGDPQANWYRTPTNRVASTSSFSPPACASTFSRSSASGSRTSSAVVATATATSPDATCGSASGFTCIGFSVDGVPNECCSQYNYCGNTAGHCGTGCQAGFGKCGNQVSSSAASASASVSRSAASVSSTSSGPSATPSVTSPDATCGAASGFTCIGFAVNGVPNECCSQYNYCGNTEGHCGTGCQAGFGKCGTSSSSSALSSSASVARSSSVSSSASRSASSSAVSSSAVRSSSASSSATRASSSVSSSAARSSSAASSSASSSVRPSSSSVRSSSSSVRSSSSSVRASSSAASSSVRSSSSSLRPSSSSSARVSSSSASASISSTLSRVVSSSSIPISSSTRASSSLVSSTRSSSATPSATVTVSTNGQCGSRNGATCLGYRGGECCGTNGYCGISVFNCFSWYCDKKFGKCW